MRWRASLIAAFGLTVAIVACGGSTTTSAPPPSSTTAAPPATTPAERLHAMLLGVGDVGAGWQVGPDVTDADFSDATQILCGAATMDPAVTKRLTPVAGVQFEPTDGSYKHLIQFLVGGEREQLASDLQTFFRAMEACPAETRNAASTAAMTVTPFPIPDLGDQHAAYVATSTEAPNATWYVRMAVVRVGSVATEIGLTEILPSPQTPPTISDAEFVQLVRSAVTKLDG